MLVEVISCAFNFNDLHRVQNNLMPHENVTRGGSDFLLNIRTLHHLILKQCSSILRQFLANLAGDLMDERPHRFRAVKIFYFFKKF